jgi:hypothetical protein
MPLVAGVLQTTQDLANQHGSSAVLVAAIGAIATYARARLYIRSALKHSDAHPDEEIEVTWLGGSIKVRPRDGRARDRDATEPGSIPGEFEEGGRAVVRSSWLRWISSPRP